MEYIGKLVKKITLDQVTYPNYLTILLHVNKKEPFLVQWVSEKMFFVGFRCASWNQDMKKGLFWPEKKKKIAFHIHQRVLQGFNFPEHGSFLPCCCPLESGTVYYILRSYEFLSKFSSEYEL